MFNKLLVTLVLFSIMECEAQVIGKKKTILFIGAHPDDETAISEVLTKYARLGNKVYVLIATNGKDGTRVTKIPAGDSLGNLRMAESICSCKALGIEAPIFLGIERLDTKIGTGNYFKEHQRFLDSLMVRIPALAPDVIITAGPDGDTHHSEHIVVGAAVAELLLAEGWVESYALYHFSWAKGMESVDPGSYMHEKYVNLKISYTDEDEERAIEALNCYITQYTPEELMEEAARKRVDKANTTNFRKFVVMKGLIKEFE